MKILIALETWSGNGHGGGTETWASTLAEHWEAEHEVFTTKTPDAKPPFDPELALICHGPQLKRWAHLKCSKVFTCHGVVPRLEIPVDGADHYVGVSEETAEHVRQHGFDATVIRNPIDTRAFTPDGRGGKLQRVLHCGHQQDPETNLQIAKACQALGLTFQACGGKGLPHFASHAMPRIMNASDIVIGLGRVALEAMACGKSVVVAGPRHGLDGRVTPENVWSLRRRNFSGRTHQIIITERAVAEQLEACSLEDSAANVDYVRQQHGVQAIAEQYLKLA